MRTIHNLHHVNIETAKFEETRAFYEDLLGLTVGRRATLPTRGYWMYLRDEPILHLLEIPVGRAGKGAPPNRIYNRINRIDHFGVMASGLDETIQFLDSRSYKYTRAHVRDDRILRLFVEDPNGVIVELSFLMEADGKTEAKAPRSDWHQGAKFFDSEDPTPGP
jgi:catechol 2,3-dioxygenase-like lactoylglutathione lyase family enzyme